MAKIRQETLKALVKEEVRVVISEASRHKGLKQAPSRRLHYVTSRNGEVDSSPPGGWIGTFVTPSGVRIAEWKGKFYEKDTAIGLPRHAGPLSWAIDLRNPYPYPMPADKEEMKLAKDIDKRKSTARDAALQKARASLTGEELRLLGLE